MPKGFVPFFALTKGMTVRCSAKEFIPELNFETGEVCLVAHTERAPRKTETLVFLYQDRFQSVLLATCKVEVYAMQCMRLKLQTGAPESIVSLQLRSAAKRTVEFFSSNPKLVCPPGAQRTERLIQVIQPNEMETVSMAVKVALADSKQTHAKARVQCVDLATRELVYAWLFDIEVDKPLIQRAYQVTVAAGRHTPFIFAYVNPLGEAVTLEFVSSKPALMEVRRERQFFESRESTTVELFLPPQAKAGAAEEAILYVNDEHGKVSESLLFKILVTNA